MNVIEEIAAERKRQIEQEGWTPSHDDEHTDGSLAKAAGVYALGAGHGDVGAPIFQFWPWSNDWFKWKGGPRRMLIKAAALIVAEIERLDRITAKSMVTVQCGKCGAQHTRRKNDPFLNRFGHWRRFRERDLSTDR